MGVESGMSQHTFDNGDKYIGNWKNHKFDGFGVYNYASGSIKMYQGNWINNLKHGKGKEFLKDGTVFEGSFFEGKKQG